MKAAIDIYDCCSGLLATHDEAASILKHSGDTVELVSQYRPNEFHAFQTKFHDIMANKKSGSLTTTQMKTLYVRWVLELYQHISIGLAHFYSIY